MADSSYKNRDPKLETGGKMVAFYEREFYCFSNFSSFQVKWRGKTWMTSEHAYQASRFMGRNKKPTVVEKIFKARSADDAYKIAQKHKEKSFEDYRDQDLMDMESILRAKLRQNPYVRHKLAQTGNRTIVEDSPVDGFWGWGKDKKGRNELGKLWMKLRKELSAKKK